MSRSFCLMHSKRSHFDHCAPHPWDCLVPRRLFLSMKMCMQRKAGRRQPTVCTFPMAPCSSSPVTRLHLAKNLAPDEEAAPGLFVQVAQAAGSNKGWLGLQANTSPSSELFMLTNHELLNVFTKSNRLS